jgi:UPF0176 protein
MASLHNRANNDELKERLLRSEEERQTLSFYRYTDIENPESFRDTLYAVFSELSVFGRIYLATEGINAQISIPTGNKAAFEELLSTIGPLKNLRLNYAIEDDGKSFYKLIIKVRSKIVADGLRAGEIDLGNNGSHLSAEEFNALTDSEKTVLVDMRNHYESEVGHFDGAILPDVETFREALPVVAETLKDQKDRPVVMYCTGGIRCEKASAYLVSKGFNNVYQLDGGIIEYARQVRIKGLRNKFRGKNFVFDERLGERIGEEVISKCHQCGKPSDRHVNCANDACHILFIQCESCAGEYDQCCSQKCADFIKLPAEEQRRLRKTEVFNGTTFGKGRYKAARKGRLGSE